MRHEPLDEFIIQRVIDDDAIAAHTDLAAMEEPGEDGSAHRMIKVGVVKHHEWRVTAKFEANMLERFAAHREFADMLANPCRSGERNQFRNGMERERIADVLPRRR